LSQRRDAGVTAIATRRAVVLRRTRSVRAAKHWRPLTTKPNQEATWLPQRYHARSHPNPITRCATFPRLRPTWSGRAERLNRECRALAVRAASASLGRVRRLSDRISVLMDERQSWLDAARAEIMEAVRTTPCLNYDPETGMISLDPTKSSQQITEDDIWWFDQGKKAALAS
jgi:hypothetical protein